MATLLATRQVVVDENGDVVRNFWWTDKGQAIKWGVFMGLFLLFSLYIMVGYLHAKRRIKKGLPPLSYHRWLLSREQRAIHDPNYRDPTPWYTTYRPQQYGQQYYGTEMYPPPSYGNMPPPPTYQPPQDGTKIDPTQWRTGPSQRPTETGQPAPEYTEPLNAPPPAALHPSATGSSGSTNPFRL